MAMTGPAFSAGLRNAPHSLLPYRTRRPNLTKNLRLVMSNDITRKMFFSTTVRFFGFQPMASHLPMYCANLARRCKLAKIPKKTRLCGAMPAILKHA
ncbi:hypothetical protein [Undibacterium sp.]|jgi:hypothetical protein|uniref:hypothetical protein n=1 Tax=Undibacterium sp. TaxID=1914977 RepID=UPI002BDE5AF0|nr:hypothetical protein [Undibacterium sp.]HTD03487.1 hypothetical protein [Undibacterium sp.]